MSPPEEQTSSLELHAAKARAAFEQERDRYQALADWARPQIRTAIPRRTPMLDVTCRLKRTDSFEHKAAKPHPADPEQAKYAKPLEEIEDIVGVRVITFFPEAVDAVRQEIASTFVSIDWSDKREQLQQSERVGYRSLHGVITLTADDCPNAELVGLKIEVQIRTILQHAWAEIEHDLQYKDTRVRDTGIRRRFLLLAATLELADRELQSIHDDHRELREQAQVASGRGAVPVERSTVRDALDEACPGAERASEDELDWILEQFERLGLRSMDDVRAIMRTVETERVEAALKIKHPRGQRRQVDDALLAAFGDRYVEQFNGDARVGRLKWRLRRLREQGLAPEWTD